jgi:hypothetical protein
VLLWGAGPVAVAVLAAVLGHGRAVQRRGPFLKATASLSEADRAALESVPALSIANATWAFGGEESLRKMFRAELDRLPESEGARRARVFLRFGIIDTNPDGQAALFAQACVADTTVCSYDQLKAAAAHETGARFVPPGNVLPLPLVGGHPRIGGGGSGDRTPASARLEGP